MARIAVLPDVLVDQIAAGEVVERPASVVKELVENALDAGAGRVVVEVEGGGIARISVADDGCGMDPGDARLALERHATSKLRTSEDLGRIGSLGFRGEALPSIASVARLVLVTSPDGSGLGTEVVADRGETPVVRPARQTKGTRVVVEDLFGNVPARRKFLKSQDAEQRAVVKTLTALALSRPDVAFTLRAGERELLALPAAPSALERFAEVMGRGTLPRVLAVDFSHAGMRLTGAVSPPETTFASRTFQWLFVNGRAARDGSVAHATRLAAEEALLGERSPAWALYVTCPPEKVDPNVHPQKSEVRFLDPGAVHALVHRGLRAALTEGKSPTALPASVLAWQTWVAGYYEGSPLRPAFDFVRRYDTAPAERAAFVFADQGLYESFYPFFGGTGDFYLLRLDTSGDETIRHPSLTPEGRQAALAAIASSHRQVFLIRNADDWTSRDLNGWLTDNAQLAAAARAGATDLSVWLVPPPGGRPGT